MFECRTRYPGQPGTARGLLSIGVPQNNPRDVFRDAYRRQEVEVVCVDLLKRYQHTIGLYPPMNPAACLAGEPEI